jgi:hypothetical protein
MPNAERIAPVDINRLRMDRPDWAKEARRERDGVRMSRALLQTRMIGMEADAA